MSFFRAVTYLLMQLKVSLYIAYRGLAESQIMLVRQPHERLRRLSIWIVIVYHTLNGVVNTIEGNSGDICARRSYSMGSDSIFGYGVVAY